MAYTFIGPDGQTIKTKSIKEFARTYGFPESLARNLHCGYRARLRGFCSTSQKPRVKKLRKRFLTKLTNLKTGENAILGASVKRFAQEHDLSLQGLSELVNNRVSIYRHWVKAGTAEILNVHTPDGQQ